MPITINDCFACGKPPHWAWDDMGGGIGDLIFYCNCLLEDNSVKGSELADTAEDWNRQNAQDQR